MRSKLDADYGKDASTDFTFGPIVKRFRNIYSKVNLDIFGAEDSDSPDNDIYNPNDPPPEPSYSHQPPVTSNRTIKSYLILWWNFPKFKGNLCYFYFFD